MRLARFEGFRYVGDRISMRFYDTDDENQSNQLLERIETESLLDRNCLQAFAPDTPDEAQNRGFRPAVRFSKV